MTDNWDYTDLQSAVQELLTRLMFSGNDEQNERKLINSLLVNSKTIQGDVRAPKKEAVSTEIYSLEQPTE